MSIGAGCSRGGPDDAATAIVVLERAISYASLIVVGLVLYVASMRRDILRVPADETGTPRVEFQERSRHAP
jgi:hypothetical protein